MQNKMFIFLGLSLVLFVHIVGAQTWSPLQRLTWNSGLSTNPSIAADTGSGIHLAWQDYSPGNAEIFYKKSPDKGTSWSAATRMTWNAALSSGPWIAVDSSFRIHIVWSAYVPGGSEVFYKRSLNGGLSWSPLHRLTWSSGNSFSPIVGVDGANGVHVVWYDDSAGNFEIYYKKSTDGGANWSIPKRLTWNPVSSIWPRISLDSGTGVHIVWEDGNQGDWNAHEILYKRSMDSGTTWQAVNRLTWNSGGSYNPCIDTDSSGGVHIAWHDSTPGFTEIYYKKSTDSGVTWMAPKRLTYNSGPSNNSSIAVESSSKIHIVWDDFIQSNYEVCFKSSSDGGGTWSGITRLTWNTGNSYYSSTTLDSTNGIHVVWHDETPGNSEIYYKNRK